MIKLRCGGGTNFIPHDQFFARSPTCQALTWNRWDSDTCMMDRKITIRNCQVPRLSG